MLCGHIIQAIHYIIWTIFHKISTWASLNIGLNLMRYQHGPDSASIPAKSAEQAMVKPPVFRAFSSCDTCLWSWALVMGLRRIFCRLNAASAAIPPTGCSRARNVENASSNAPRIINMPATVVLHGGAAPGNFDFDAGTSSVQLCNRQLLPQGNLE